MNTSKFLGPNSYPGILEAINKKFMSVTSCETIAGNQLMNDCYTRMNESKTPVIELKAFTTEAEKISGSDTTLKEIVDFCRKQVKGGDFNFLINIIKEEHFANLTALNHPAPEATIKAFEDMFSQPSSEVEQGIRNGIFDSMKSSLLSSVKADLKAEVVKAKTPAENPNPNNDPAKPLNESMIAGNLITYNPIGIKFENHQNDQMVLLTENNVLSFDRETKDFAVLNESQISALEIPSTHKRLMSAIVGLGYDPTKEIFRLNENWDFDLMLLKDGSVSIGGSHGEKSMKKEDVRDLLLESIKVYSADPLKVENFNRQNFIADADNFIALMENHNSLVKFDKLVTIKNMHTNDYALLADKSFEQPMIIGGSFTGSKMFESYEQLTDTLSAELKSNIPDSIKALFAEPIKREQEKIKLRQVEKIKLLDEQKSLNESITDIARLKGIAEDGSPAMIKLCEQEKQFNSLLDINIANLKKL